MKHEKFNKYVHLLKVEGKGFLFHLATGEVCALDDRLFQLIADNFQTPATISERHPDFMYCNRQLQHINMWHIMSMNPEDVPILVRM